MTEQQCPKCGNEDTWIEYCDGCNRITFFVNDYLCKHGDPEHFHRGCKRCSYKWRTDDVIDAKVVCDR